jgi:hypothetical protein
MKPSEQGGTAARRDAERAEGKPAKAKRQPRISRITRMGNAGLPVCATRAIHGKTLSMNCLFLPNEEHKYVLSPRSPRLRARPRGASQLFAVWISPSLPQTCGGEGRGEEARQKDPLSLSLSPLTRGEGMENRACARPQWLHDFDGQTGNSHLYSLAYSRLGGRNAL